MNESLIHRALWTSISSAVLIVAIACGSSQGPPSLPTEDELNAPVPTQPAVQQPTTVPTQPASSATPTPTETDATQTPTTSRTAEYDPVIPMSKIFQGIQSTVFPDFTSDPDLAIDGLKAAREAGDKSMVPVVVTLMRFINIQELFDEAVLTLRQLTSQDFGDTPADWGKWFEWVGQNLEEYSPPNGYAQLKRRFLANIEPSFEILLIGYENSTRINPFEVEWGRVGPDGIPPLENPPNIPADEADYLVEHERVFGVSINGEHRAYPLRIMNSHEMANDVLGGEPISLAYCTLCGSGIAYSSKFAGVETTFGTSGFLYRSNKLMYDRETFSIWNQATGEPVIGPLANSGFRLDFFPTLLTTWGEWTAEHPDTTVLDIETGIYPGGRYFPEDNPNATYNAYFSSPDTMFPVWLRDDTLATKDVVLGLKIGVDQKAYPVDVLQEERVINDALGDTELVVLASEISQAAKVYERGGHEFSRLADDSSTGVPTSLVDEDGTVWEVTEEALVSTSDSSQALPRIPTHMSFWFGWFAFYPDTLVYEGGS